MRASAAQAAGAATVTRPRASATALADGAQVAETNRTLAGAAAAATGPGQAEPAQAVGFANLVTDQAAENVLRIIAERRVAPENRRDVRAFLALEQTQDAGLLRRLLGENLGKMGIRVVLGTLQAIKTRLVLRGLLAHFAFFALVTLALAALLVGALLFEPFGNL